MRLAVLDLGSISFQAMVVDSNPDGSFEVIARAKTLPRIGQGVFETGIFSGEAIAAALDALAPLKAVIDGCGPEVLVTVATAAVREATNGADLLKGIEERFGIVTRVISGLEEARYIYLGARFGLGDPIERLAVFDLGGGSLEIALGQGEEVLYSSSRPLGILRLVAEHPLADPPSAAELAGLARWVAPLLTPEIEQVRQLGFERMVFCAGTARSLLSVARALVPSTPSDRLSRATLARLIADLSATSLEARRRIPGLSPQRADLIVPGAVVLDQVLALTGIDEALVVPAAFRYGLICDLIRAASKNR